MTWPPTKQPWEEVAMSIIESLIEHDLSPGLARDYLKSILDYAEAAEQAVARRGTASRGWPGQG